MQIVKNAYRYRLPLSDFYKHYPLSIELLVSAERIPSRMFHQSVHIRYLGRHDILVLIGASFKEVCIRKIITGKMAIKRYVLLFLLVKFIREVLEARAVQVIHVDDPGSYILSQQDIFHC